MKRIFIAIIMTAITSAALAQAPSDPTGYVTYSLPSTVITLDVEAVQETFHAGPYAKYAEKYLGIKPRMNDQTTVQVTSITMTPFVEADLSCRYSIKAGETVASNLFYLSSAGLVTFADATFANETIWRFPIDTQADFTDKGLSSNLTSQSAILYKNEKKESRYSRVAVQQDMVVEKTLEQKARETANVILDLRKQRLQIVTGDTDATYSGEAMGTAVAELTRLENEYMTLFIGYSEYQTQKMRFDVIPEADRGTQRYVAFRISDNAGLLPADDMTGKPIVMEVEIPEIGSVINEDFKSANKTKEVPSIYYRIPAASTVKVKDGSELLLQTRIPVYQLGQTSSVPLKTALN